MSRGNDVTEWQCDFCQRTTTARLGGTPPGWVEIKVKESKLIGDWAVCSICWQKECPEMRSAMEDRLKIYPNGESPRFRERRAS